MNKQALLKNLTKLANYLDEQGKYKIANAIDNIMRKNAGNYSSILIDKVRNKEPLAEIADFIQKNNKELELDYGPRPIESALRGITSNKINNHEDIADIFNFKLTAKSWWDQFEDVSIEDVAKQTEEELANDSDYQKMQSIRDNLNGEFKEIISKIYDDTMCYEEATERIIDNIGEEKGISHQRARDIYDKNEEKYEDSYFKYFDECQETGEEVFAKYVYESFNNDQRGEGVEVIKNLHEINDKMTAARNKKLQEVKKELGWKGP